VLLASTLLERVEGITDGSPSIEKFAAGSIALLDPVLTRSQTIQEGLVAVAVFESDN
jgi:hypothetical protein